MKKRVLVFCDFYLPGFRSGGGMRTVVNLVDRFCDRYDFFVFARNYDSKADTTPYTSVITGEWNSVGNAKVFYAAAADITAGKCVAIVIEVGPDLIFLNSTFSTPVVKFLMARKKGRFSDVPVIIAPSGELSIDALSLKPLKKKAYLAFASVRQLYDGLIWKASSLNEADQIKTVFGNSIRPMLGPDLAPKIILPEYSPNQKPVKRPGIARFVSLSRVVPIKNIRYFLELLREIGEGSVILDIVGPLEDKKYWAECKRLIDELPDNITVNVSGALSYTEGLQRLVQSHFFVLPTLSENFGYVFIESLSAGTPILISDQTMWGAAEESGGGWSIPLEKPKAWLDAIVKCI
ncbi:MAG: glycosyltransferase family 4 protein, partial [Acidobacteriota bacterium]